MKKTIEVEITNFECDEEYYNFNYSIWVDGKLESHGEINDDHSWDNLEDFTNMMLNGNEAIKLALENL